MEIILFFIAIGFLFHYLSKQEDISDKYDNDYESPTYKKNKKFHEEVVRKQSTAKQFYKDDQKKQEEYQDLQEKKQIYFKSKPWQKLRRSILFRDNYKCSLCPFDTNQQKLHVHHKTYKNLFNEPQQDLILLCKTCHFSLHRELGYPEKDNSDLKTKQFWSTSFDKKQQQELTRYNKEQENINKLI